MDSNTIKLKLIEFIVELEDEKVLNHINDLLSETEESLAEYQENEAVVE